MIKSIVLKVKRSLNRIKWRAQLSIAIKHSRKLKIINSEQAGELILQFKEKSFEAALFPKVYDLSEESSINFKYPSIEIRKYVNAQIYSGSDFVILNECAVWTKYFNPQWTKIFPQDDALLKTENQYIFIRKPKHEETVEFGFSLCGVHCTVWSHFISQYLPKLYFLKEARSIINQDLTIVLPIYKDQHIREIVNDILRQFKQIKIIELEPKAALNCKVLYHLENTSHISDHAIYLNPSDTVIPRITLDLLKKNLVDYYLNKFRLIEGEKKLAFRKLYIGRTGNRNILNNVEIENFFVSKGFEITYPHLITLEEKVKLFFEASEIVGPLSSGFANIIFCQPKVKALAFVNFQRIFDGYTNTLAEYFGVDLMLVTGDDVNSSIHSSFEIPLERIQSAYSELLS